MPAKAFISFDFDHDKDVKELLVGQAKNPDTPFSFGDASIKEPLTGDWEAKVRRRIKNCDVVIVMCGEWTFAATGVATELRIAKEERVPYFLLRGRPSKTCYRPSSAEQSDSIYKWEWDNLKKLIQGYR